MYHDTRPHLHHPTPTALSGCLDIKLCAFRAESGWASAKRGSKGFGQYLLPRPREVSSHQWRCSSLQLAPDRDHRNSVPASDAMPLAALHDVAKPATAATPAFDLHLHYPHPNQFVRDGAIGRSWPQPKIGQRWPRRSSTHRDPPRRRLPRASAPRRRAGTRAAYRRSRSARSHSPMKCGVEPSVHGAYEALSKYENSLWCLWLRVWLLLRRGAASKFITYGSHDSRRRRGWT